MRIVLVLLLALAGCKKGPTLEELTKIKDDACACKDLACAQKVSDRMESLLKSVGSEDELDDKEIAQITQAAMCTARQGVRD
jgi:hypothetical protein